MTHSPTLIDHARDYLALRRRLGFVLVSQGRSLLAFARYADRVRPGAPLTVDLAVEWATATRSTDPSCAARRLTVVRGFARHRALFDPETQVPPTGLVGARYRRKQPHIYSSGEIAALLEQAAALPPPGGLRPRTFVTLLGVMLCTGLRVSEARNLTCRDVDLDAGVILVREGKFRKSRLVPLHASTVEALRRYAVERDACPGTPPSDRFFRTERLAVLSRMAVQSTFAKMRMRLGWSADGRTRMPRLQDTRHTFVVTRLLRWHVEGIDVDHRITALATYLGHTKVSDTYWYLSAVPELMAVVGKRFEHFARQRRGESS